MAVQHPRKRDPPHADLVRRLDHRQAVFAQRIFHAAVVDVPPRMRRVAPQPSVVRYVAFALAHDAS